MHFPGGNATDPIWRVLASPDGISSWTPLKLQHRNSNSKPQPLANQLRSIIFLTPPTHLIIDYRLPAFLESLMPLKNWCWICARCSKSSLKYSIRFCGIPLSLKQNFIAYHSSKVSSRPDCIFKNHQLWQSLVGCIPVLDVAVHLNLKSKKLSVSVTRKVYFYPRTGFYFCTCEDGVGWHLIPYRISPRSEFFSQAYKHWHITWGINLGLD